MLAVRNALRLASRISIPAVARRGCAGAAVPVDDVVNGLTEDQIQVCQAQLLSLTFQHSFVIHRPQSYTRLTHILRGFRLKQIATRCFAQRLLTEACDITWKLADTERANLVAGSL